ncbi:ParM/StbA family protein [Campylobacter sp. RM12651]|uniref:ParM/StbA family protein n=1 Tax=Campylobacter sp. RM12651 TaxID=1660079 RepID=UPI001EFC2412|nr:ParM/StbA family protein [Campylobacter sp. RM12651]ULO03744.1 segregation protein, ParM family [Campylobacter sp. RM12651]
MEIIAIDIGYGDVKVLANGKEFKFPNAICLKGVEIEKYKLLSDNVPPKNEYLYNGKKYLVDKKINNAMNTRNIQYLLSYAPLLVYHALKLANIDLNDGKKRTLVTGLSVFNFKYTNDFGKILNKFYINDELVDFEGRVKIRPQGRGIFDSYQGNKKGLVYVVDVGYNTLDILAYKDGEPIPSDCFANEQGANKIIQDMKNILENKFDEINFTEQKAKEIFNSKKIEIAGEEISFADEIETLKSNYTEYLINLLSSRKDILYEANLVIFSGGGAYFLDKELIKELVKTADFSELPYEFANVRGYYEYYNTNNAKK